MSNPRTDCMRMASARLEWARRRIDEFERAADDFLGGNPYLVVPRTDDKGNGSSYVYYTFQYVTDAPLALRFMAGDAVHHLRAIVDNLMYRVGKLSGTNGKLGLEFKNGPAHWNEFVGGDKGGSLLKLPDAIQRWYIDEQRHNRPNQEPSILHRVTSLWNTDKHRVPSLLGSAVASMRWRVESLLIGHDAYGDRRGALKDGAVLLRLETGTDFVNALQPVFTFDVAFEESDSSARLFLRQVEEHIRRNVFPLFEPHL